MQVAVRGAELGHTETFLLDPKSTLTRIKNTFYRCQFSAVIATIAEIDLQKLPEPLYIELQLLKVNALYELQKIAEAKDLLRAFGIFRHIECKASFNYGAGKLSYFEGDYAAAEKYFYEIPFLTQDHTLVFRSLLGLANVYFSQSLDAKIPAVFVQLNQLRDKVNSEDIISYELLLGNFYGANSQDKIIAYRYFHRALAISNEENWSYFVQRSLYGLAVLERSCDRNAEMQCILAILQAMTAKSESLFLRCLIQEKFKSPSSHSKIEVDAGFMRIKVLGKWLALHDKPLIFSFLHGLHQNKIFVTKKELAKYLWPKQTYLPRTHDPRIFDIAKRVRQMLETISNGQLTLLSGRQGYKLVSTPEINNALVAHEKEMS
jgi:hypothetical protein